jgi:hypothetical protein
MSGFLCEEVKLHLPTGGSASWISMTRCGNESIVGADRDGYFRITLISPDSMEKRYVHNGGGGMAWPLTAHAQQAPAANRIS